MTSDASRDTFYLHHIVEWIGRIETYTSGGRDAFFASSLVQDATIRGFEVIGEAVKHLSEETTAREPQVPWRQIAGFRDVLIHNYIGVDLGLVWEAVVDRVPELKRAVVRLLEAP